MKRTTIFADENMLDSLKEIARMEGISIAEVIKQALNRFIADRQKNKRLPSILGIGHSGRKDIAERSEELLWKETPPTRTHLAVYRLAQEQRVNKNYRHSVMSNGD